MKRVISIFLALCLLIGLMQGYQKNVKAATIYTSGDYTYSLDSANCAKIESYFGSDTAILIPSEIDGYEVISLGVGILNQAVNVQKVTVPKGIKTVSTGYYGGTFDCGPFAKSSVTEIIFEDGITKIPDSICRECTTLEKVTIPDTVTGIGNNAFSNCSKLTEIDIPDAVTKIGNAAFDNTAITSLELPSQLNTIGCGVIGGVKGIQKITIPKGLVTAGTGYYGGTFDCGPFAKSSVTEIIFEDGITKIPDSICRECTTLEKVTMPKSVVSIGNYSFANCSNLREILLSNSVGSIGNNCFFNCNNLIAFCNYFSNAVISCIDENVTFAPSEEKFVDNENKMLDRTSSMYYANTDSLSASGILPFTIKYGVKNKWKGKLSNKKIVTHIPQFTELDESSVKMNGKIIKNYTYNDSTRRLTIPVSSDSGEITYCVSVRSKEKIKSYAFLSATKEGVTTIENIDAINEEFTGITLLMSDITSTNEVNVSGVATPSSNVTFYVNGEEQDSVVSLKNGSYSGKIKLENPIDCYTYRVEAKCTDEYDSEISATRNVVYKESSPELVGLEMKYNEHNVIKTCDLMNTNGVKPKIYYLPESTFRFEAEFKNIDNLDNVYITSTRNNEKKIMEAEYDSTTGKYVTDGYFDESNHSYVPGQIGVEYTTKNTEAYVTEDYDFREVQAILGDELDDVEVTYDKNTEEEAIAEIDMSSLFPEASDTIVKTAIKHYVATNDSDMDFGTVKKAAGLTEKAVSYIIPGVDDSKYFLTIDRSDPANLLMVFSDGVDIFSEATTVKFNMTDTLSQEYYDMMEASQFYSSASLAVDFIYNTYGIYSDHNDLITEIQQSSYIDNKFTAMKQAEELRSDRMAFMVMTTVLPLLVSSIAVPGVGVAFSGMIALMSLSSGVFFDMRVANIKGEKFSLNWVIDPSGYIYDASTNEIIEGATVSAYWIPYDGTDEFWNNKPGANIYGTLWDASEYEQENPLKSNVDGKYAWDVPEGWWRVKVEKEGYITQWSDWMEVPPVQTDVNIGLTPEGSKEVESTTEVETTTKVEVATTSEREEATAKLTETNKQNTVVKNPSSTKIKKVKAAKKSLKITWKKTKNVSGYQIQYSTSKKFKKAQKITIKKAKTTSKTIKKLKAKKKYYVRVRTYITVNGKKYYSDWSKAKSKKTK